MQSAKLDVQYRSLRSAAAGERSARARGEILSSQPVRCAPQTVGSLQIASCLFSMRTGYITCDESWFLLARIKNGRKAKTRLYSVWYH